jgi:ligand-binding sensor domain-containing protein
MKKYVGLTVIILIQILQPGFLIPLDPDVRIQDYIHDAWRVEEGLPQNSVRAIVQTQDGYLWFGTQEGLVRFDGIRFKVFDRGII